jgi:hypothetical protein
MSVQAISWVLEHSESRRASRHVLISIANHCDSAGQNSFPSVSTIARESKISDREVRRSLKILIELGELAIERGTGPHGVNMYSMPKMMGDKLSSVRLSGVTSGREVVTFDPKRGDKSDHAIRKNRPEPSTNRELLEPSALRVAELLRTRILQNNPSAKITDGQIQNWAVVADRMIRLDDRTAKQIEDLIEWSQKDDFWCRNILSMEKLRTKFDQLTMHREGDRRMVNGNGFEHDLDYKVGRPKWTGLVDDADEKEPRQ